jgi:hypothetical protein
MGTRMFIATDLPQVTRQYRQTETLRTTHRVRPILLLRLQILINFRRHKILAAQILLLKLQVGGNVVPLVNTHLGVFHNENGVFIPWRTLCNNTQQYLLKSCDRLINPDGSLTSDGDRAAGCIWNGAVLTGAGIKLHLPLGPIGNILGGLASLTGCGDIANINQIQSSPIVQSAQ